MTDRLETFIISNKKAFSNEEPSAEVWARIAADLKQKPKKKSPHLFVWFTGIAATVALLAMGLVYIPKFSNNGEGVSKDTSAMASKETHFRSLIIEKKDSLAIFATANPDLYRLFTADLGKLDEEYMRLKDALETSPNRPAILEAMIKNREIQLRLLKQQLLIINQVDSYNRVNQI